MIKRFNEFSFLLESKSAINDNTFKTVMEFPITNENVVGDIVDYVFSYLYEMYDTSDIEQDEDEIKQEVGEEVIKYFFKTLTYPFKTLKMSVASTDGVVKFNVEFDINEFIYLLTANMSKLEDDESQRFHNINQIYNGSKFLIETYIYALFPVLSNMLKMDYYEEISEKVINKYE